MVTESVEGQAIELGWRKDNDCDLKEADYLDVMDGIFAMHPGAFKHSMDLFFRTDFETNQTVRDDTKSLLELNGVIRP